MSDKATAALAKSLLTEIHGGDGEGIVIPPGAFERALAAAYPDLVAEIERLRALVTEREQQICNLIWLTTP